MPNGSGVRWAECLLIIGTGCRVQVFFSLILDSSVGLSAGIQSAEDWVTENPGFESCILQRKTTCLLSIRKSFACARASKLTTTNMYIARARCECQMAVGQVGWMLADHRDGLSSSSFLAWSSIAQSVCQQAFSLLKIGFQRPPGFESCILQRKTTCLLSIRKSLACARASKLTTNMYIARARCECQMAVGSGGLNACWS